jgi:uncharacterized membrane protein
MGKESKCSNIEDTIMCPASAQVSFFGIYQIVIVIVVIIVIYLIYALNRKRKHSKHMRKHSKIKVKRRKSR